MIEKINGLDNLIFTKDELIKKLEENLKEHKKEYTEAVEGYWIEVDEQLKDLKKLLKQKNIDDRFHLSLNKPENHENEYIRLIEMLKFCNDDELVLSQKEFNNYVLDEWDWARHAKIINASYASTYNSHSI